MWESEGIGLRESREQAVRAELDHLLKSPAFRTSKRCKEFLEYIVEHTMIGQSGSLKERSLGVGFFRLPADFDPSQHTIVRVTANEVRKKLAQHYLSENGAPHTVRIGVPPGSYRVEFRWETPAAEPSPEPPAELPAPERPAAEPVAESHAAEPVTEHSADEPTAAEPPIPPRLRWFTTAWFTPQVIAYAMAVLLAAGALLWWSGRAKPVSVDARSISV